MKNRTILIVILCFVFLNSMTSCSFMPEKAQPVRQFDVNRYLGKWYEIARFDYYFEKDFDNAMAQYNLNADGSVKAFGEMT
ncbi:lipocalin family protein [Chryseobacterium tructae]|uniref:Lipocalin family protein n=1 Tax=Chryseobacterium tructae TaxID=1037380 RepID=A0ABV7XYM4_9FLAO|nr:lipocalin family protein [Chryseobacterium tructae]MDN3692504.1 lipocalin family protein [Chryseobacterium tructae]